MSDEGSPDVHRFQRRLEWPAREPEMKVINNEFPWDGPLDPEQLQRDLEAALARQHHLLCTACTLRISPEQWTGQCPRCGNGTMREMNVPPEKQREGDQPLPHPADGPAMQDLLIADIEARKAVGLKRYGQLLKADDGRDNLKDILEELIDAAIYIRKEIYKRDGR